MPIRLRVALDRQQTLIADNGNALYLLVRSLAASAEACAESLKRQDGAGRIPETAAFLNASLLRSVAAGCLQLLMLARSDRFGSFRGLLCDG